ncbi:MAG: YbaB/EbfC family nucleoid-associated protein [Candidatus Faecalibacterium intestinavium]|uniref:Nucleoid-associated protein H9864_04045 n=1 Tax=Candidatus Faecalibacterium intestinavium TaxID=2838580 RepID=A0A9E2KKK2_9FIRM|nr:YbaB/EbfC family nucleoid-associated protein [Candidatus Faecalibacterium intestinavium]
MKARMPGGYGRPDMNALLRQAQKMQDEMKAKQAELEAAEYTGSASGEMVTVRMNGKHEVLSVTIKPEAVDPDDIEMLEDLVAAAFNATVKQVDDAASAEMGKLTGGMNLPGMGL